MLVFVVLCALGAVLGEAVNDGGSLEVPSVFNYHHKYGIAAAARIKAAEEAKDFDGSRIIGGNLAFAGNVPHMGGLAIILTMGLTSVCGSTMISNTKVVTAAHCWFDGVFHGHTVTVVLGSNTLHFGGTRFATQDVVMHPQWNPSSVASVRYNVAVITIQFTAYNNIIKNAELPSGALVNNNFAGSWAQAAGFGLLTDAPTVGNFQFLYHVNLQVITNSLCSQYYGDDITAGLLCTSGEGQVGICRGDTGGPLTINDGERRILIGISSFFSTYGCDAQRPSGFTRVTSVVDWILSNL